MMTQQSIEGLLGEGQVHISRHQAMGTLERSLRALMMTHTIIHLTMVVMAVGMTVMVMTAELLLRLPLE
jgi:hypothetical protein